MGVGQKGDVGAEEIHCGKSQGKAFLVMEIACAKAVRQDCDWCVGGSVWTGVREEWEESRWERQARSRLYRTSWSVIKSQDFREKWAPQEKKEKRKKKSEDFILRAMGRQWRAVSSEHIWSDFGGNPSFGVGCTCLPNKIRNCHPRTGHPSMDIFGTHTVPGLALWRTPTTFLLL